MLHNLGLISLVPNVLLFLFPGVIADGWDGCSSSTIFSYGQALAAGGLLGDVFLHTLPHAYEDAARHQNDEEIDRLGVVLLIGFSSFYVVDVLIRIIGASPSVTHQHKHEPKESLEDTSNIERRASVVILNLVADSLHNFTDGLAIGSSYALTKTADLNSSHSNYILRSLTLLTSRGGLASISVFFHEIPHEIGDFSILVSHGYTKRQAINLQFITAIAAFCGTAVGLLAVSYEGDRWMLPFTAGGFVYVAAVSILPDLLKDARGGVKQNILQLLFFGVGVSFMQAVALLEHIDDGNRHDGLRIGIQRDSFAQKYVSKSQNEL
jgi:zinc transporter 7